jgi:hypothetical protein
VNTLTLWNMQTPAPLGTLRGSPTIAVTATQLNPTITLGNCTGANLFSVGSSFENDTNADGTADGWTAFTSGTTGTVTNSLSGTAYDGAKSQQIACTGLGTASSDRAGVRRDLTVSGYIGRTMYGSAWVQGDTSNPCQVTLRVDWLDGGGSTISTAFSVAQTVPAGWTRLVSSGAVVPGGAVTARYYLWADQRTTSAGAVTVRFDAAQFELDALTDYARATLRAGDLLGYGGQVSRAMADTAATDDGRMVVEVLPRVRGTVGSGSSVTWNAPTVAMVLASGGGVPIDFMPADISGSLALQLVEA